MTPADLAQPQMLVSVTGGALAVYAAAFAFQRMAGRSAGHPNIVALAGCYSNTAFIGLPIATILFGAQALGPVALAGALYAGVVFATGVLVGEIVAERTGMQGGRLSKALRAVIANPLIVSAIAGVLWAVLRLPLTGPADTLLATLGAATPGCALLAIGLFIARPSPPAGRGVTARILACKLVIHPLVTLGLVLALPPMPTWGKIAVLMAAMPTGTSSFVLAGRAGEWALRTSVRAIVATMACSAITLIAFSRLLLAWLL